MNSTGNRVPYSPCKGLPTTGNSETVFFDGNFVCRVPGGSPGSLPDWSKANTGVAEELTTAHKANPAHDISAVLAPGLDLVA